LLKKRHQNIDINIAQEVQERNIIANLEENYIDIIIKENVQKVLKKWGIVDVLNIKTNF